MKVTIRLIPGYEQPKKTWYLDTAQAARARFGRMMLVIHGRPCKWSAEKCEGLLPALVTAMYPIPHTNTSRGELLHALARMEELGILEDEYIFATMHGPVQVEE